MKYSPLIILTYNLGSVPFGVFFGFGVRLPLLGVFFCFGVRKVDPLPIVVRTTSGQEVVEAFDEVGVGQAIRRDYGMRI